MNESVELAGGPELIRNSLILTGLTFRTFSLVVSECFLPLGSFHCASPTRSPLKGVCPGVTLKVALTLAPGATALVNVFEFSFVSVAEDVQCRGTEMLRRMWVAGSPVVFVKLTVVSCAEPSENVCKPGGAAVDAAGDIFTGS